MLRERQVDEIVGRRRGPAAVLDRARDADDLDGLAVGAIEANALAHRIGARPVVLRELLVDDGHARRRRGVGRAEAAPAQDRDPHRLEVTLVDGVHRRSKALAVARHLERLRHEGHAVELAQAARRILRVSRAHDSGSLSRALGEPFVESRGLRRVVLHEARVEPHHQDVIGRVAGPIPDAVLKAPDHQEGRRQQHQRHRDLRHHQRVPAPQALAAGGLVAVGRLETPHEVRARALQRRREAAEQRAQNRQGEAGQENPPVHAERDPHRQLGRDAERLHEPDAEVPDRDPAEPAEQREDQALGQQQPDQPEAPRADRQPDRDLARPRARAAQQQPGGVGARDQQHDERERREDHAELPVDVAILRPHLEHGAHGRAALAIELRILALEVPRDHGELVLRLRSVAPGLRGAPAASGTRSSRSVKKSFCGPAEKKRAIASGM